jgi:hypothetical protein
MDTMCFSFCKGAASKFSYKLIYLKLLLVVTLERSGEKNIVTILRNVTIDGFGLITGLIELFDTALDSTPRFHYRCLVAASNGGRSPERPPSSYT